VQKCRHDEDDYCSESMEHDNTALLAGNGERSHGNGKAAMRPPHAERETDPPRGKLSCHLQKEVLNDRLSRSE
jgi:hypothetical protein